MLTPDESQEFEGLKLKGFRRLTGESRKRYQELKLRSLPDIINKDTETVLTEQDFAPAQVVNNSDILLDCFAEIKDGDDRTRIAPIMNMPNINALSKEDVFDKAFWAVTDGDSRAVIRKHFSMLQHNSISVN